MLTTMDEEVLELWTNTVTRTPITRPATGLDNTTLSWKISPAAFPLKQQQKKQMSPMARHMAHVSANQKIRTFQHSLTTLSMEDSINEMHKYWLYHLAFHLTYESDLHVIIIIIIICNIIFLTYHQQAEMLSLECLGSKRTCKEIQAREWIFRSRSRLGEPFSLCPVLHGRTRNEKLFHTQHSFVHIPHHL